MNDEDWAILEDKILRAEANGEIVGKNLLDIVEEEYSIEAIRNAEENLMKAVLEALRIPAIVSWLNDKIEQITGK